MMRSIVRAGVLAAASTAAVIWAVACSDSTSGGSGSGSDATTGSAAGGSTQSGTGGSTQSGTGGSTQSGTGGSTQSGTGSGASGPCVVTQCQAHVYECGDCIDNDNDGLIDWQDPDCLGPCDNTEDSYHGGISGQNNAPCKMDCYFDQDTGSGNDDCYWNHACDPHSVPPDYYPEPWNGSACEYDPNAMTPGTSASCDELYMQQSQLCYDFCGPLTPNGCDCFGCCELPAGSGKYVYLGSIGVNENTECTQADIQDPTICHPCLPVQACLNDCDICELCIGKPTLPPECYPDGGTGAGGGGTGPQCPPGLQACGLPGQPPCPAGFYCITGCCQQIPT